MPLPCQPQVPGLVQRSVPVRQQPGQQARQQADYRARLARSTAELAAAQALRFEVFKPDLDEGRVQPCDTGLDADDFDEVCDPLIVQTLLVMAMPQRRKFTV